LTERAWSLPQLWLPALAVAIGLGAGAGCSNADRDAAGRLPVELSSEDTRVVLLAEQELVGECMRREGFDYVVIPPSGEDSKLKPPFGSEDVSKARTDGYGFDFDEHDPGNAPPPGAHRDVDRPTDRNTLYVESLPPARQEEFDAALFGQPEAPFGSVTLPNGQEIGFPLTGCFSEARERLYGNVERYMTVSTFINNLGSEIARRAQGDTDLIDRLVRWRACMRNKGYRFADPGKAREEATNQPGAERAIAVADTTCARDTHLVDVGRRLFRKYQHEVYSEFEGRVLAYNELVELGVKRAKDVLRG
jgi:hypothetical protein